MKTSIAVLIVAAIATIYLMSTQKDELSPQEFAEALKSSENRVLIDTRSGKDFSKGHIPGAVNLDPDVLIHEWQLAGLNAGKNVFIYCQNGEQSKRTVVHLEARRFNSVTRLKGGMNDWLKTGYPVTPEELVPPLKLTFREFSKLLDLENLVIVYFYASGDPNLAAMGSALDELAIDYQGKIKIFRINTDDYTCLAAQMGITFIPTLQFYENGNLCETLKDVDEKELIEKAFHLKTYVY